ncbi:MAG: leucine-rich repeat protein [Tenuifilaceae bacterium]
MKKLLYLIYIAILSTSAFIVNAQSGKTGKLHWNISNDTLTISGYGEMPNYKYKERKYCYNSPWYSYLKNIKNIVICEGVSSIGDNAFYVCDDDGLTFVNIFGSDTTIDENFPNYCGVTSVLIPNSVTRIGGHAFRNCRNLISIVIPNSVLTIGSSAFSDCRSLTSFNIPDSITIVESYVFDGCSNMSSVSIPNTVTYIKYSAFRGCHSLNSVTIPNSVTRIGGYAFAYSRGLTSITIPNSVVDIDNSIFPDCDSLSEIINYATIPQTLYPYKVFSNVNMAKCILRVPESAISAYRLADGWKEFENIVAIKKE